MRKVFLFLVLLVVLPLAFAQSTPEYFKDPINISTAWPEIIVIYDEPVFWKPTSQDYRMVVFSMFHIKLLMI